LPKTLKYKTKKKRKRKSTSTSTSMRKRPQIVTEIPLEMPGTREGLNHCFTIPSSQSMGASADKCILLIENFSLLWPGNMEKFDDRTGARGHHFSFL
jgi:hypothetical protein